MFPEIDPTKREPALQTAKLSIRLFNAMGADVTLNDIDSAHIVPRRNSSSNGPKTKNLQILTTNRLRKCHVISPRN